MLLKKTTDDITRCSGPSDKLRVSGLSISLSSGVKKKPIFLLKDASFSASICQVVGILGLSSSGKTSILNALGGLYGSGGYKLSGSIQYPSKFYNPLPRHCFIWVDECYDFNITVEEYLKSIFALSLIPSNARQLQFYMDLLLDAFKLKHLRHCIICSSGNKPLLSLYDRKRISLCRAFIQRPNMLLIDEITSGLSEEESDTIFSLIKNYNACRTNIFNNEQITILTLHQPSKKLFFSLDKVVIMDHGNVMFHGTPFGLMEYLQKNYSFSKEAFSHMAHPGNLALYIFQMNRCDTINSHKVLSSLFSSLRNTKGFQSLSGSPSFSNDTSVSTSLEENNLKDQVNLQNKNTFKLQISGMVPLKTQVKTLVHRRFLQYKRHFYLWLFITLVHLIHSFLLGFAFNEDVAKFMRYTNKAEEVPVDHINTCLVELDKTLEIIQKSFLISSKDWCPFAEKLAPGFITLNRLYNNVNFTTIVKALKLVEDKLCIENSLKLNLTQDNFSFKHFIVMVLHGLPIINDWQEGTRCEELNDSKSSSDFWSFVYNVGNKVLKDITSFGESLLFGFSSWDNILLSNESTASNSHNERRQLSDIVTSASKLVPNTSKGATCDLHEIKTAAIDTLKHIKPITNHLNNTMRKVFLDGAFNSYIANEAISNFIDMIDVTFKQLGIFIESLQPNSGLNDHQVETHTLTEDSVPMWILSLKTFLLNIFKRNVVFVQITNAFLFHIIFVSFISYSNLLAFVRERTLFNREIKQNLYSTTAYFISRSILDIPLQTIPVILMSVSFYFLIGLHKLLDSHRFTLILVIHNLLFLWICILISVASYAFVSMVASISPSLAVAMSLLTMFLVTWLTTIGFLLRQIVFPAWIIPIQLISFYRWGFFALINGTFLSFNTPHTTIYRLVITLSGLPDLNIFFFCFSLFICIIIYFLIAFSCLCYFHKSIGLLL